MIDRNNGTISRRDGVIVADSGVIKVDLYLLLLFQSSIPMPFLFSSLLYSYSLSIHSDTRTPHLYAYYFAYYCNYIHMTNDWPLEPLLVPRLAHSHPTMPNSEWPHLLIAEIPEYPYVSTVATVSDWLRICSFSNLSESAKSAKSAKSSYV